MNKKGFTLVELLAIFVILSIISIFTVTSISNLTNNDRNNEDLYDTIYMAAETYIYSNYDDYSELDSIGSTSLVRILDLINGEYLKNEIINPKDNEKFDSGDYIKVTRNEDKTLSFEIVDSFPTMIKLVNTDNNVNNTLEFASVLFDSFGGKYECYNQVGKLNNLTFNSLAIGKNQVSCSSIANNGTTATLTESIDINGYFDYTNLIAAEGAYVENNVIMVPTGGVVSGPNYDILAGCYFIEITGSNFSSNDVLYSYEDINGVLTYNTLLSSSILNDKIIYYVNLNQNQVTNGIEFYYKNNDNVTALIKDIKVTKIDSCPVE